MKSGLDRKTKSSSLLIYKTDEKDLPFAYSNKIIYKS